MQNEPEQWAVQLWEAASDEASDSSVKWRRHASEAAALTIQAAFAEREARLVGAITSTNAMACTPDGDGSHKITLHYPDTSTAMAAFVQLSDIADSASLKDRTHG